MMHFKAWFADASPGEAFCYFEGPNLPPLGVKDQKLKEIRKFANAADEARFSGSVETYLKRCPESKTLCYWVRKRRTS